jgi:protein TonB
MTSEYNKTTSTKFSLLISLVSIVSLSSLLQADDVVIRISESDAQRAAITRATPDYPPMARQMHVSGPVIVEAEVTTEGQVAKVQPVSGNALLSSAAVNAVKKWKFKPFIAEGKPAKAVVRLSFNFTL